MKKRQKYTRKHQSITVQITLIFVGIMALTILSCFLVNNLFLEKFYTHEKEKTFKEAYSAIMEEYDNGNIYSRSFDYELKSISSTHNVSIAIVTSFFEPVKVYSADSDEAILRELRKCIYDGAVYADRVIEETKDYLFITVTDKDTKSQYLEMLGRLHDEAFFFMRTPIESIRYSAVIANRFLLYIGLACIVISSIVIFVFSRHIVKPLKKLAAISEKMAEMDFAAKYDGKERNEIGDLGRSVNKMSSSLEQSILELKSANASLKEENDYKTRIDELRKEFISNVSHDLKTPIALIQGYAEGLKEGVNEKEERDYYCDVIMDEAGHMNKLVKQLLNLNQLESGDDIFDFSEFDLSELVSEYVQSAEILAKNNDIEVAVSLDRNVFVNADELKIEEVIANFFSNAINHCESEDKKRIDVTVKRMENRVEVSVFNTGVNIPEEAIPHLFDKFYRVDKARTRAYGGSGIGLSIVKAILDAHHGEYGVENLEGGVRFFFRLDTANGGV